MRRRVFWVGVALGKYLAHGRARGALLLLPHIVIGMGALVGMVASMLGWHWFGWKTRQFAIVLGASLVASVFWWRDWRLPVVAILAGPLLIAAMLVSYGAESMVFITDGAEHAFRIIGRTVTPETVTDTKRSKTSAL